MKIKKVQPASHINRFWGWGENSRRAAAVHTSASQHQSWIKNSQPLGNKIKRLIAVLAANTTHSHTIPTKAKL